MSAGVVVAVVGVIIVMVVARGGEREKKKGLNHWRMVLVANPGLDLSDSDRAMISRTLPWAFFAFLFLFFFFLRWSIRSFLLAHRHVLRIMGVGDGDDDGHVEIGWRSTGWEGSQLMDRVVAVIGLYLFFIRS